MADQIKVDFDAGSSDSIDLIELPAKAGNQAWDSLRHRADQQDVLIKAMVSLFTKLNGSVVLLVFVAWIGDFRRGTPLITEHVIMALIGATVVQSGISFLAIMRYLFPQSHAQTEEG